MSALLKIDIERINVVGEAQQQTDPSKKYIRFDVLVKEDGVKGVGRVFDLEIFLCPRDIFNQNRPIYEFENREKYDHNLTLGDRTYKFFCNFSEYDAVTDESVRDYLKYFATDEATSDATKKIHSQVDFYHNDPKTRSDYVKFKDMLEEEREEEKRLLAKAFRDRGVAIEVIADVTGLSADEIKAL